MWTAFVSHQSLDLEDAELEKNDFIDTPIFYATMKTCSRNSRVSYVGSSPENIFRSVRSCSAPSTQLAGAQVAAQMANIRVMDLWNNKRATMVQETIDSPMIDQHADDLTVSGEDVAVIDGNKELHLTNSEVQSIVNSAMLRYEKNTLRWLTDGIIQEKVETHLRNIAEEATKGVFNHVCKAVEESLKQTVNRKATDNVNSSTW